jgi:hypothetical protein
MAVAAINQEEYLQCEGLLALGRYHYAIVNQCEAAMSAILDPDEEYGSSSWDVLGDTYPLKEHLKRIKVAVTKPEKRK